jgi:hypothetical protein
VNTCEYSHLDGSYVLGALSPAERQEFERHLETCTTCAAAVRQLAGLPGLLARVDADVLVAPPAQEAPPDTLLPSLVREVRRSQRRRGYLAAGAAAAAMVAVSVGSLALAGDLTGDETPSAGTQPTSSTSTAPSPAAGQDMVPVGDVPVQASVAFESVPWGTRLSLTCTYTTSGDPYHDGQRSSYSLYVRTRDGRAEQVATWRALPGRTMMLDAATSAGRDEIVSVEVRTAEGQPVLKLTT